MREVFVLNHTVTKALRVSFMTVLLSGLALPQTQTIPAGQKATVKGVISARNGAEMTIQQDTGGAVVAVLNGLTRVQMKEGLLKARKKSVDVTALIPGLRIEAQGDGNSKGQLEAKTISFSSDDLKDAREIQAGTNPIEVQEKQLAAQQAKLKQQQEALAKQEQLTQQQAELAKQQADFAREKARLAQQAANLANKRISSLDDYSTKYTATVYFATGVTAITNEGKSELLKFASQALATDAYMIQVRGFASTTGSVEINQELSQRRAEAVIAFLTRSGKIPLYRILAPGVMGESTSAGSDPKLNQRVVAKVLVNQGIAQ
jgi:outer membrane protein OmpA-like peptidoglycan-associated protein